MDEFQEQVVLVTGAAGDLGRVVVGAFLERGAAAVVASDRNPAKLAAAWESTGSERVLTLAASLDDPAATSGLVAGIEARFGRLDVLAHCAGGFRGGQPAWKTPVDDFDAMWASNARATFLVGRAVFPVMLRQRSGAIVAVVSGAALKGSAGMAAYSAAKAAALRVVESLAAEGRPEGIRANAVLPGTIDTPQNRESMPGADRSSWATPEQVAELILFLASARAAGVTGAAVPIGVKN
jgi:NAD(P)-dependent dehydrogenase (short-subunit alcohol dehydrogenase family)